MDEKVVVIKTQTIVGSGSDVRKPRLICRECNSARLRLLRQTWQGQVWQRSELCHRVSSLLCDSLLQPRYSVETSVTRGIRTTTSERLITAVQIYSVILKKWFAEGRPPVKTFNTYSVKDNVRSMRPVPEIKIEKLENLLFTNFPPHSPIH